MFRTQADQLQTIVLTPDFHKLTGLDKKNKCQQKSPFTRVAHAAPTPVPLNKDYTPSDYSQISWTNKPLCTCCCTCHSMYFASHANR